MTQNQQPRASSRPAARPQGNRSQGTARPGNAYRSPAPRYPKYSDPPRPLPKGLFALILIGIIACFGAFVLQHLMPNGFSLTGQQATEQVQELSTSTVIRICEVMSSNTGTIVDENGVSCDWVELVNTSDKATSLAGWSLAHNQKANDNEIFTFGDVTLGAGARVIIFCDGTSSADHAPFKLSSSGDTLMLFNEAGTAVDSVNIPALDAGTSYALDDSGKWFVCYKATPGETNDLAGYETLNSAHEGFAVRINEIVPSNKAAIKAADGGYYDYIELYNTSSQSQDLTGCYLSDSMSGKYAWRFPDGTSIPANGYLLVFCSGLDTTDSKGCIHTSFRLASGGEQVVLTDATGTPRDSVTYGAMAANRAWSLKDGSWSVAVPTPGEAN